MRANAEPFDSLHSAQNSAVIVRDYIKWDDQPASLTHFSESLTRAYELAITPPAGPVLLVADSSLQEAETQRGSEHLPQLRPPSPPVGDPGAIEEAATMLVAAQSPAIVVDRLARSQAGVVSLVQLAEALQAPVIDQAGRMNMPTRHYLNQTRRAGAIIRQADVIMGVEVNDFWGTVNALADVTHRKERRISKDGARLITLTSAALGIRSNFQDFQRRQDVTLAITGDGEATLPYLLQAVRKKLTSARTRADRALKLKEAAAQIRQQDGMEAAMAWEATPISVARLCAEVGKAVEGHDWSLASHDIGLSSWPHRLWDFKEHHQYMGHMGGIGIGYTLPGAIGTALALKDRGTLVVNIIGDGDFLCAPQALWTAAHHQLPLLTIMHNNRAYHQEVMHVQRMACRHSRGIDRARVGTAIDNPNIDFGMLAKSQGVWSAGPIADPKDLGPTLKRAIEVVRAGAPALIDVVSQPR